MNYVDDLEKTIKKAQKDASRKRRYKNTPRKDVNKRKAPTFKVTPRKKNTKNKKFKVMPRKKPKKNSKKEAPVSRDKMMAVWQQDCQTYASSMPSDQSQLLSSMS